MENKEAKLSLGPASVKNKISEIYYEGQVFFICTIGNTFHLAKVQIWYTPKNNVIFDFDVMDAYLKNMDGKTLIEEQVADEIYEMLEKEINPEKLKVKVSYIEKSGLQREVIMDSRNQ